MILSSLETIARREREAGRLEMGGVKTDPKKPNLIIINTDNDKIKNKIKKIEQIKRRKINKNEKPSELLKYYDYLSYEYPKLIAKGIERENELTAQLKKEFEDKPKETNKIEVKTSSFVDVGATEKLRRELIDTEEKLKLEEGLRGEVSRKAKAKAKEEAKLKEEEEAKRKEKEAKAKKELELLKTKEALAKLTKKEKPAPYEELFSTLEETSKLPPEPEIKKEKGKRRTKEEYFSDLRADKSKFETEIKSLKTRITKETKPAELKKLNKSLEQKEFKLKEIKGKLEKAPRTLSM